MKRATLAKKCSEEKFESDPAFGPQYGERGLDPDQETRNANEEQGHVGSASDEHVDLGGNEHGEPRSEETGRVLQKEPDQREHSTEEREPGTAEHQGERQASDRPPEHAVGHVLTEVVHLRDQDDRSAVEDVAQHEQSGARRRSRGEILPQREPVGSGGEHDHPRQPHAARNGLPVRPDNGYERESDEEQSQNDQDAVRSGLLSHVIEIDTVETADRTGLIDGNQFLFDPRRRLGRQIFLEQTDQPQCLALRADKKEG